MYVPISYRSAECAFWRAFPFENYVYHLSSVYMNVPEMLNY